MTSTFAVLAALALSMQPQRYDTVVLANGGVLRGTVVEDVPGADLVLLMPDGTTRKIPRAEVARVEWAQPAEPMAPPPPPPYPAEPPPPPPPPRVLGPAERPPLALAGWIGGAFPAGTLDGSGLALSSAFTPQFLFGFEASWRVIDPLELGLYLRVGAGTSRAPINDPCLAYGGWCDAVDVGMGFFPRWSFAPRSKANPWVQVGGGYEYLAARNDWAGVEYGGWELGAWAGVDFGAGPLGAIGVFAGTRWGEFTTGAAHGGLPVPWGGAAGHGWIDAGVRWVWWP